MPCHSIEMGIKSMYGQFSIIETANWYLVYSGADTLMIAS